MSETQILLVSADPPSGKSSGVRRAGLYVLLILLQIRLTGQNNVRSQDGLSDPDGRARMGAHLYIYTKP